MSEAVTKTNLKGVYNIEIVGVLSTCCALSVDGCVGRGGGEKE